MPVDGRISRAKTPADMVLSRMNSDDGAHGWIAMDGSGLTIALFMQRHDETDAPIGQGRARARLAYRNFQPKTAEFTQRVECDGGTAAQHDCTRRHPLRAAPSGRYVEDMTKPVEVVREAGEALVMAELEFQPPSPLCHYGKIPFAVPFRAAPPEQTCLCCLRLFPS